MHSEKRATLLLVAALMGATLMVASPAAAAATKPERLDVTLLQPTGEVRRCIQSRMNVSTRPAGDTALMFRESGNRWWRNDLRGSCPAMRDSRALVFRNATGQYCELDLFDVVDTLSRSNFGTCSLGKFTPVEVPKGARF